MLKSARAARSSIPEDTETTTGVTPIRADRLLPTSRAGYVSWLWHLLRPKHPKSRRRFELRVSYISAVNQRRCQAVSQSCLCHVSYNSSYKILLELSKYVTSNVNIQVRRLKVAAKIRLCNKITKNFISALILTYYKDCHICLCIYLSICLISCLKPNEKHKRGDKRHKGCKLASLAVSGISILVHNITIFPVMQQTNSPKLEH